MQVINRAILRLSKMAYPLSFHREASPSCTKPPQLLIGRYFPQTLLLEILATDLTLVILSGCNLQILGSTLR